MTPEFLVHNPLGAAVGIFSACIGYALAHGSLWAAAAIREHSDRSREQMLILRRVVRAFFDKEETFALALGLTKHQLAHVWAGTMGLDLRRMASLPDAFHLAWIRAQAARQGAMVYEAPELEFFRGMSRARMARMSLPETKREGVA